MKRIALAAVAAFALTAFPAAAGKYAPTLEASPNPATASDVLTVSGCGYNSDYGNVILNFNGGAWGTPIDASGCIAFDGIPVISGDSVAPGEYPVRALQYVNDKRLREVARTHVTVIP